jgi:hypothetical protein
MSVANTTEEPGDPGETDILSDDHHGGFILVCPLTENGCWVALRKSEGGSYNGPPSVVTGDDSGGDTSSFYGCQKKAVGSAWLYIPSGRAAAIECRTFCYCHPITSSNGNPKAIFCFWPVAVGTDCRSVPAPTDSEMSYILRRIANTNVHPAWLDEYTRTLFNNALEL